MKNWFIPKDKPSFKERISITLYKLEVALDKLRRNSKALKRRDIKFFNKCIQAQLKNDYKRAILYANECAEIRKLAKLILTSELALEQAILRLQTANELNNIRRTIAPIVGIVQETKARIKGIIPSVAGNLDEITNMIHTTMDEMGSAYTKGLKFGGSSLETEKILEKANEVAEERIREKFPQLPKKLYTIKQSKVKIPIALTVNGGETQIPTTDSIKKHVYDYIKARNGKLSVVQCASSLGVVPLDVEEAILELKEDGKITLE